MNETHPAVGKAFKMWYRSVSGELPLAEVARRCGITRQHLSAMVHGHKRISFEQLSAAVIRHNESQGTDHQIVIGTDGYVELTIGEAAA